MRFCCGFVLLAGIGGFTGCHRGTSLVEPDHPQLSPQVRALDITVHSAALGKDMPLRIVVPADPALAAHELPVVYFLHGAGNDLHDWTNHSNIAGFAAQRFVLVFPDAPGSYYIDDLRSPRNHYEQYLTQDVVIAVHVAVPAATHDPERTAIVGISRGGYGAMVLGMKHPELYRFIGSISGALDFAQRGFRWRAPFDSMDVQRAFGRRGSGTRRDNDPYRLVMSLHRESAPFFFIACGNSDSLLDPSQRFARALANQRLPAEIHFAPGGHNWSFWGNQIPALEASLRDHFDTRETKTAPRSLTGAP